MCVIVIVVGLCYVVFVRFEVIDLNYDVVIVSLLVSLF